MLVDGHMQYVFDEQGTRYLDFFAGIVTVSCGHCHPKIVARTEAQLRNLQHTSTVYLNPGLPLLAEKLASKLPGELEVTYFVNSGSEANDLAMLMARLYSGNFEMLALRNAYHGGVSSVMGLTAHHTWKYPVPHVGVQRVACPDPYRSAYSGTAEEVAHACAEDIRSVIRHSTPGKVAGFIAEPIQGVGGAVAYGGNYFGEAYKIVREHGGLCIADEVQTGFGRTGERYWGFENYDVVPDIVTMAKGLGNGAPIAAVSTTREIAETLAQRIHINTFGGNPVSMAQGLATLDVIDEEDLQNNAHEMGQLLQSGLLELMEKYPLIGEVRGIGLMSVSYTHLTLPTSG